MGSPPAFSLTEMREKHNGLHRLPQTLGERERGRERGREGERERGRGREREGERERVREIKCVCCVL